jgi:hypothetical protein
MKEEIEASLKKKDYYDILGKQNSFLSLGLSYACYKP